MEAAVAATAMTGAEERSTSVPSVSRLSIDWLQPLGLPGLSVFNYVMRILTLGTYHFWGKTEVRKRIWSAVRLDGEPLAYTGTGRELLLGFLVIFGVMLLPVMLLSLVAAILLGPQSPALITLQAVIYAGFFLLYGVATHRAQRYRLSRTRWRGIRGSLEGSAWRYGFAHFWTALLIPPTLGGIMPWRSTYLQRLITEDMRFGNRTFTFTAGAGPLYPRFVLVWLATAIIGIVAISAASSIAVTGLMIADPTSPRGFNFSPVAVAALIMIALAAYLAYALVSAWYRASQIRHFAAHTHVAGATFTSTVSGGGLIWLTLTNFLIVLLSLGLLAPIAQARAARYFVGHLSIEGAVALSTIGPGTHDDLSRGEGLAQAFDFDAF